VWDYSGSRSGCALSSYGFNWHYLEFLTWPSLLITS
jgi:hypothetical protein